MDMHFVDGNGNHFVVPDAPDNYARDDAARIEPPPTSDHRWIDGAWRLPEPPAPATPEVVTRRQAKLALYAAGYLDQVEALAASDPVTHINWTDALEFRRDHPLILAIGSALELDDAAIDQLFIAAAAIP